MIDNQEQFKGLNCTINTTEDCNLRCKYCYETCKTTRKIDIDKCYKFIDLILSTDNFLSIEESWSLLPLLKEHNTLDTGMLDFF